MIYFMILIQLLFTAGKQNQDKYKNTVPEQPKHNVSVSNTKELFIAYHIQGCQNRDFTSGRKEIAKSELVKSQSKSKDFTQRLL